MRKGSFCNSTEIMKTSNNYKKYNLYEYFRMLDPGLTAEKRELLALEFLNLNWD